MAQVGDFVYKATEFVDPRKPNGKKITRSVISGQYLLEFIDIKTRVKYTIVMKRFQNYGGVTLSPRYNSDGSIMLATTEEIEEYRES